jgi:signal transduction histidine kinase
MSGTGELKAVNLVVLLDEIIERYAKEIKEKGLSVQIGNHKSTKVTTDPYLVELLLDNILSNAIKYSGEGGMVEVAFLERQEYLICRIKDEGIGIKAEDMDKLFTPFFRSQALQHKQIKGNGLGLAIAKKISDVIRVDMQLSSQIGKGTEVELTFPRKN